MRGLFEHFKLTLLLNFKSRQALIYGYLVPIFFLIAFGSIFRNGTPPLLRELGQLLTISILGGACFGMPTAMVAERERGVWRRYRLLPTATGTLVISTMLARVFIVLSAALLQILLAKLMYGMPFPEHPIQMIPAFLCVTFAFLGMGLIIAMLSDAVPAVQALGQTIFLPMIIIGGVGVPLWTLPAWAQHLAGFLPGKYAVHALDVCAIDNPTIAGPQGLTLARFDLLALLAIGSAACIAGAKMFRWDAHEKPDPRQRRWVLFALAMWLAVGITAELAGHTRDTFSQQPVATEPAAPASATASAPAPATAATLELADPAEPWHAITPAQIAAIEFEDFLLQDEGTVLPVAKNLDTIPAEGQTRATQLREQLAAWPPGHDPSPLRRTRNFLSAAGIADLKRDEYEAAFAYLVFEKLRADISAPHLEKILTWIILHPTDDHLITAIPELNIPGTAPADQIQQRQTFYAKKLLMRLTGKIPAQK